MIKLATGESHRHGRKRLACDRFSNLEYDEAVAIAENNKELILAIRKTRVELLAKEIKRKRRRK